MCERPRSLIFIDYHDGEKVFTFKEKYEWGKIPHSGDSKNVKRILKKDNNKWCQTAFI